MHHNAPRLFVTWLGVQVDRARCEGWGRKRSVADRPGPIFRPLLHWPLSSPTPQNLRHRKTYWINIYDWPHSPPLSPTYLPHLFYAMFHDYHQHGNLFLLNISIKRATSFFPSLHCSFQLCQCCFLCLHQVMYQWLLLSLGTYWTCCGFQSKF